MSLRWSSVKQKSAEAYLVTLNIWLHSFLEKVMTGQTRLRKRSMVNWSPADGTGQWSTLVLTLNRTRAYSKSAWGEGTSRSCWPTQASRQISPAARGLANHVPSSPIREIITATTTVRIILFKVEGEINSLKWSLSVNENTQILLDSSEGHGTLGEVREVGSKGHWGWKRKSSGHPPLIGPCLNWRSHSHTM